MNPERVSNIKPFTNKYNWEGIYQPSKIDDWKTFEKSNPIIALNIFYAKEKEISFISKLLRIVKKKLMIPNEEKDYDITLQ